MRINMIVAVVLLWIGSNLGAAESGTYPFPAPRDQAELDFRMGELYRQYEPFLQSLPVPLKARTKQVLDGPWKMCEENPAQKYEKYVDVKKAEAEFLSREKAAAWWKPDLDESSWLPSEVPSWYKAGNKVLWFRTRFSTPQPQAGRRQFLHFGGADYRAQVWLNGVFLGEHITGFEDFRLDVTDALCADNILAVRIINGYWEKASHVCVLPASFMCADKERSLAQWTGGGHGNGCGLFRPVTLETTGVVTVQRIFACGFPDTGKASVDVELDARDPGEVEIAVEIIPENFTGSSFKASAQGLVEKSIGRQHLEVVCPEARLWSPDAPHLYRCRVEIRQDGQTLDAEDALFGFRSFTIAPGEKDGIRRGQCVLNGKPIFLRGTNVQYLNVPVLWGERETAIKSLLMLKAAHFNFIRNIQHIPLPETLELQDRLGIIYEADVNCVVETDSDKEDEVVKSEHVARIGARVLYNHPGCVMISLNNEGNWFKVDGRRFCEAVWESDPQRVIKPISGGWPTLPKEFWRQHFTRLIEDYHDYNGWYLERGIKTDIRFLAEGRIHCTPGKPGFNPRSEAILSGKPYSKTSDAGHLYTVGEFGGEGKDAVESYASYPKHWGNPPPQDSLKFWHPGQASRMGALDDPAGRYAIGLRGRLPANMLDMIEATQVYQADQLSGLTRGFRLGSEGYAGYMQFHFKDMLPVQWQKSVVSYDFRPKKAYFEMAQCNQPFMPLFVIDKKDQMTLWVDNDLDKPLAGCKLKWRLFDTKGLDLSGQHDVSAVPPLSSVKVHTLPLRELPASTVVATIAMDLADHSGTPISNYRRELYLPAMRPVKSHGDGVKE